MEELSSGETSPVEYFSSPSVVLLPEEELGIAMEELSSGKMSTAVVLWKYLPQPP